MRVQPDSSALHPRARAAVRRAEELQWTVVGYQSRRGPAGIVLAAPKPHHKTICVPPVRQWNERKAKTLMAQIERYGRPPRTR